MPHNRLFSYLLILTFLFLQSCANYRMNYSKAVQNWEAEAVIPPTNAPVEHTVFLLGDAGHLPNGEVAPALKLLQRKLAQAAENSSVLFLGNNTSPGGLPPKSKKKKRKAAEKRLDAQLDLLRDFKGTPLFIPGNKDWEKYGLKGLKRQEKYIEKQLNAGIEDEEKWANYFFPDDGCAGPELIEVNERLA
ncbi:MAG: hypothetical protein AAF985_00390, partial [Bacteroidota bacterium]